MSAMDRVVQRPNSPCLLSNYDDDDDNYTTDSILQLASNTTQFRCSTDQFLRQS